VYVYVYVYAYKTLIKGVQVILNLYVCMCGVCVVLVYLCGCQAKLEERSKLKLHTRRITTAFQLNRTR